MSTSTSEDKLRDLLKDFHVAMLTTRTSTGELRARPMAVADVDSQGVIWLLTDRGSEKMEEISHDSHVNVTMQSSTKFVSYSGTAAPDHNRTKIGQLWKTPWTIWFPNGKEDPDLVLIRIQGHSGEYWDMSGTSGIKYLIEAGSAYLAGTKPHVTDDSKLHGKVAL